MHKYQEENIRLEELMSECAANNAEYWEELGESVPSLPKLRSLASKYVTYSAAIASSYVKTQEAFPESCAPTANYLHFLLQVGVDVKETVRVREELKAKLEKGSEQRSSLGGLLSDEVAMIAVDSVGGRLGHIVNCNGQTRTLLGYEKSSLLEKNITRIMPKIYGELHNNFILSFLQGRTSGSSADSDSAESSTRSVGSSGEKVVTPLTNEGFLVEVGLRLHPVADVEGSLLVVGFMSKREDNGEAIVMVDSNSGVFQAIDSRFSGMLRHKVSGKQVVTEEVRISSLFPELNMARLEREGSQDSLLEVEHLCEEENASSVNLEVTVELRRVKLYEGRKLTFLSIIDKLQGSSHKFVNNFQKNGRKYKPRNSNASFSSVSLNKVGISVIDMEFKHYEEKLLQESNDLLVQDIDLYKNLE